MSADILRRAAALDAAGRSEEAAALYRGLLTQAPGDADILNALAVIERRRGNGPAAEALLRKAIVAAPGSPELHNNLGNILHAAGRLAEAESSYRRAIALKPESVEAQYHLGLTLEKQDRPQEALAAHMAAVACNPHFAPALTRMGVLLIAEDRLSEALDALDRAVAADPRFVDAHYHHGRALARLSRHDESLSAFQRAIEIAPHRTEIRVALGNCLRDAGRIEEALAAYRLAIELDPRRADVHAEYARLAHEQGRTEPFESFAAVRRQGTVSPDLLLMEAHLRMRSGDLEPVEQLLREAEAAAPGRADIFGFLGTVLAERNRFADAALYFDRAIAADPSSSFLRHQRGFALLRASDFAEARRQFEHALQMNPSEQLALAGLLLALRAEGDPRYAELADFNRFVRTYEISAPPGFRTEEFLDAVAAELREAHFGKYAPLDQTLRGGTQTLGDLFSRSTPAVTALRRSIAERVEDYVQWMAGGVPNAVIQRRSAGFRFAGSWSCLLNPQGFHTNHIHPEGWISSAFYVDLPAAVDNHETHEGWFKLGESDIGLGPSDRPERFVKPERGMLVLFPSYFWHGTVPFGGSDTRLTVAFDAVPA
jgi:tetratricopeptide (TPR) repeat protein